MHAAIPNAATTDVFILIFIEMVSWVRPEPDRYLAQKKHLAVLF
jgi:hypothetical protein